jgi:hypothetical protein
MTLYRLATAVCFAFALGTAQNALAQTADAEFVFGSQGRSTDRPRFSAALGALTVTSGSRFLDAPSERTPLARTWARAQAASSRESWARRHPAKFGAAVGAAAGAAIGIITVATLDCPPTRSCSTASVALLSYPAMGAGLGALVGWLIKHD